MQTGLAHWCELHGPTSILCTQVIPPSCGECYPPRTTLIRSPSTPHLSGGPTPPQSSHGHGRPNTTSNTPISSPTPRPSTAVHLGHQFGGNVASPRLPSPSETPPASPRSPVLGPSSSGAGSAPEACRNCTITLPKKLEEERSNAGSSDRGVSPPGRPIRTTETLVVGGVSPTSVDERTGRGQKTSSPQIQPQFNSATQSLTTHTHTVTYLSSRSPALASRYSQVRQACIRSLSCELVPAQTGPILFGDQQTGYTIAVVFKLSDSKSRGGRRTYALLCMSMNQKALMQSWNLISQVFQTLVLEIQRAAVDKAAKDAQTSTPTETSLSSVGSRGPESFLRRRTPGDGSAARSLADLVGNDQFFVNLHSAFVRLLATLSKIYGYGSATQELTADMIPLTIGSAAASDGRSRAGSVSSNLEDRDKKQLPKPSPSAPASETTNIDPTTSSTTKQEPPAI
ncbi:vesicle coat protein [Sphaerosporella brunnea]|uniref:Vesicle coat protein n=1 Tax=Sphaerosporella brunnea TaxID=1250544 RepID=A0A5J5EYM1_9PEZI|nr:vesicle coat protein [Sphaerosporella brunnea]